MKKIQWPVIILTFAMIFSAALRIAGTASKKTIDPDEGISYMAATGHLGEYFGVDEQSPYGAWVEASEWKKFIRIEEKFCFKKISSDLARHDIHPPLYFWLLHLWSLIFGIHLWTGPSLNILISTIAIALLYRLANYVLKNPFEAAVVAFVWALSPTVMEVTCHARQYDLLAFWTILLVLQIVRCADTRRKFQLKEFLFLVISSAGGALTHYHFSFLIVGCVIFLIARLIKIDRRRLAVVLISMATGLILFFLFHPQFLLSVKFQLALNHKFQFVEIIPRLRAIISTFGTFFWHGRPFIYIFSPGMLYKYIYPLVLVSLFVGLSVIYYKARQETAVHLRKMDSTGHYVLYFFFWISGVIILSYICFFSPSHAMSSRYMVMAWPFFAFIPVFIIRFVGRYKVALMICLCILQILFGAMDMLYLNYLDNKRPKPIAWLRDSDMILVDNVARGVLPGLFWQIPDNNLMFAADQRYLLDHRELWQTKLIPNSIYISVLLYGNLKERQLEILGLIRQEHKTVPASGGFWGYGNMFKIEQKSPISDEP